MAHFHWRMQIIKRSEGRSSVAASAYRAGECLHDRRTGITHDYHRRSGVERSEILMPDNAPAWAREIGREELWNRVEGHERRKDAQVSRELQFMLPREVPPEDRVALVRDYVRRSFCAHGMIADVAWHNKIASDGLEQPHAHVMLTMRHLTPEGFGLKSRHEWVPDPEGQTHPDGRPVMVESNDRSWNSVEYFERCREDWENIANAALERAGSSARIDRRSFLECGIARLPEPALKMAWYMKELYGAMRERFGQFQMARHYRAVEEAAKDAFSQLDHGPVADARQTAERFFGWFDRQIERLQPGPKAPEQIHTHNNDLER